MPIVVDANVIISALIADSTPRACLVLLDEAYVTPEIIRDEIDRHRDEIIAKSDLSAERIDRFLDIIFDSYVSIVPVREIVDHIETADTEIGATDPNDVLYLATALAVDGSVWSDDRDFEAQDLVPVVTSDEMAGRLHSR